MKKYSLIYADPPWTYNDKCNAGKRGAEFKYDCMSVNEICNLDIASITAPDCLLAMWWTGPMIQEALRVVHGWGFTLKNATGFTWCKKTKHDKWAFGMGHYTRGNAENCLFAVKGKPKRVNAGVRQLVIDQVREHSRKPDIVRDSLVTLMGDVTRLEMFARDSRDVIPFEDTMKGWDVFGHEVKNSIHISSSVLKEEL